MILCCSKNCTFLIFKVVLLDFHFNAILVVIENAPFYLSYQPNSSIQSILKIQFLQTNFLVLHCRVKASVFGMRWKKKSRLNNSAYIFFAFATLGPFSSPKKTQRILTGTLMMLPECVILLLLKSIAQSHLTKETWPRNHQATSAGKP